MSRFDYSKAKLISRTETIQVNSEDFPDVLVNNDLNRVQKVLEIRSRVRQSYVDRGYRDVVLRFVDGVIQNLIDSNKMEGRPLPSYFLFEVELTMPIIEASNVAVGLKSDAIRNCLNKYPSQEPTYYNDEWNIDPTPDYHDSI